MKKKEKKERIIRIDEARLPRRLLDLLLLSLLTALVVEGFNQGSLMRLFHYLAHRPLYFFINGMMIFATLCFSELFRSRRAFSWTLSVLWCILGFANFLVIKDRTQPLVSGDLIFTREILGLTTRYFGWPIIILTFILALLVIFGLVKLFAWLPRRRQVNYPRAVGGVLSGVCCVVFVCILSMKAGLIPVHFGDRVDAYRDYGFATCFSFTFGKTGVDEPNAYSDETVTQILDEIEEPAPTAAPAVRFGAEDDLARPNVVFMQLESFFDVDDVIGAAFSEDPTPIFHRLLKENPNGILYVPTIGGGTANVEFEVMTGLNMDFFTAGEAPFNTILEEITCESIAHDLRKNGYYSTVMHNNTGFFFSRNRVYANLGYDCFVPLESMLYPEYSERGWAKDSVLTGEILKAMDSSAERDFVCAISVESHGKYAETYTPREGDIEVLALPQEAYLASFQNYVNIIPGVDAFLGELVAALEAYDEPVLLVVYGDHLPALGLDSDMLTTGDLYASRYIIWNNYGAEFQAPDLQSYRLSAELFRQMGIADGVMTKFHQAYSLAENGAEYMEKLQTLQYDLLYGEKKAYGEEGPYAPSNIRYGTNPVKINAAEIAYGRLMVKGSSFTEFSKILAGEEILETLFVDDQTLVALLPEDGDAPLERICVAQINNDGKELLRTEEYTLP